MKKSILRCTVVLMILAFWGCQAPVSPSTAPEEFFTGDHLAGGELSIDWKEDGSKSQLGPTITGLSDVFQLVGFSGTTATSRTLKPGVTNILSLASGSWRIIVLAGLRRSSTSTTVFLVGATNQDNVVITDGTRTSLNLVLRSIDTTFDVTGSGIWNDTLTVKATGKSRCPVVGVYLNDTAADKHPRFRSLELWAGYKDATVTGTPVYWSAEADGIVPEGATDVYAWLVGPQMCLLNGASSWVPAAGLLDFSWEWINRADMLDTHPLAGFSERHVAAQPPPTGLNITLAWE
jgi:hypothetical protein